MADSQVGALGVCTPQFSVPYSLPAAYSRSVGWRRSVVRRMRLGGNRPTSQSRSDGHEIALSISSYD